MRIWITVEHLMISLHLSVGLYKYKNPNAAVSIFLKLGELYK